jgi:hypothetical protein
MLLYSVHLLNCVYHLVLARPAPLYFNCDGHVVFSGRHPFGAGHPRVLWNLYKSLLFARRGRQGAMAYRHSADDHLEFNCSQSLQHHAMATYGNSFRLREG